MPFEEVNPISTVNVRAIASDEKVLLIERGGHAEVVHEAVHR
jgi:ADP-ribose pyrophosphatase YjhB (NUDIX family)